jgi:hypothetical protein
MIPHPNTIYTINALDHEHLMRRAASDRLAASAHTAGHPRVRVAWLGGVLSRLRGARQEWVARPLTTGSAEPAHRVI